MNGESEAVTEELSEQLEQETSSFFGYLQSINWNEIIVDLAITALKTLFFILIIYIINRIAKYGVNLFFNRYKINDKLPSRYNTIYNVTNHILTGITWFLVIYTTLDLLGVPVGSLLAGAGVIGLAVSLGAQGFVNDLINGMNILFNKQMAIGDEIQINGFSGNVRQIKLTTTEILDFDGTVHFIPNREITVVSNKSIADLRVYLEIPLYVETDLDKVREVINSVNNQLYEEFEDNITQKADDVDFIPSDAGGRVSARVILYTVPDYKYPVENRAMELYIKALNEANIDIPNFTYQPPVQ